ncbi:MAG: pantoate--beta-alanine ligase [Clostridiaceae bacterium]
MEVVKTISEVRAKVKEWRRDGLTVGFVPTMGYLHQGHGSLIKRAVEENDKVVVSIFVNPIQFGPKEDLATYPRDLERDSKVSENAGASLIFHPEVDEMYEKDLSTYVNVDGSITESLCGEKRPGHFRGVATVVTKLFNIVKPDRAYFGEKDAQQLAVIKRMVRDLSIDVEVIGCPIIREEDGLAMSSRNKYLSEEERSAALVLSKGLRKCEEALKSGERNVAVLKGIILDEINTTELSKIDYIEIVDSEALTKVEEVSKSILIALAVFIGKTRLIDNFTYKM